MVKGLSILAVVVALVGCSSVPVTVAPYAGYGGYDGSHNDKSGVPNSWQVGVGLSFTLGGQGGYVTPVPGHPSLITPSRVVVDNSNTNTANGANATSSSSSSQSQEQSQEQSQSQHRRNGGGND